MKAFLISGPGGLSDLHIVERPMPTPRRHEVVLRMLAASINYRDLEICSGTFHTKFPLPLIPLSDGVGEVVSDGATLAVPPAAAGEGDGEAELATIAALKLKKFGSSASGAHAVGQPALVPDVMTSAFETWFVSAALDDGAFERIEAALPAAARAAAEASPA